MMKNKEAKKILVIRNDKIGDLVTATNVFRELRRGFPKSELTVIVSKVGRPLVEKNKNISRILIAEYPPIKYKNFLEYFKIWKIIRKEEFDIGIDLRGSIFNILLLYLGKVKYKIGYYNRIFSKIFLDFSYKKDRKYSHGSFQRIDLLNKSLGLNSNNYELDIATDEDDEKYLKRFIKKYKLNRFICIIPDASLESKQWPLDKFDEIIKYIKNRYNNYQVVLLGVDKKKINFLAKKNSEAINPLETLNLRALYLLFKKARFILMHDGGTMHLAGAANANLLALMPKHLSLGYYGPLGKNSKVISKDIKQITVKEVKKEIDSFL